MNVERFNTRLITEITLICIENSFEMFFNEKQKQKSKKGTRKKKKIEKKH